MNEPDKKLITKIVYENQPVNHQWQGLPLDKCLSLWWQTGRTSKNLRLSELGKQAFDQAEFTYYKFDLKIEKEDYTKTTLKLGKHIKCPFYIGLKNQFYKSAYIVVYDSRVAMIISLYGSVQEYLNSIK